MINSRDCDYDYTDYSIRDRNMQEGPEKSLKR